MPSNWNRGLTKENNNSVKKISETMKNKHIDNFYHWREKMKKEGKIKSIYLPFKKNGDLAELIGVTLGDGHLCVYPRTEELRIISNSKNTGFIERYSIILEKVFKKKPYIINSKISNSTRIGLYEKNISERIQIPTGARKNIVIIVPDWILRDKKYIVRYLRGLYEAEGSFNVHSSTYTYKFSFSNSNESMLNNVFDLMKVIGFNPHKSKNQIQISRKEEVYKAMKILKFRDYK
ncbi:MAG: LAGLIDADG family homing endonuclease [Candidatus Nomurabacteria bacterium]